MKVLDSASLTKVLRGINNALSIISSNNETSDLDIMDDRGNILAQFGDGHIKTKYFDSRNFDTNTMFKYEGEKIELNKKHGVDVARPFNITQHTISTSVQGCAVWDKYLFVGQDRLNNIGVYDIETGNIVNTISLTPNNEYHCNNLCFGRYKYDPSDFCPCLYISQEHENQHKCLVYQITYTNNTFSATLVQTITFPAPSLETYPYYPNSVIDTENGILYVEGYSTNSFQEADGTELMFLKYKLPLPTDGDVGLTTPISEIRVPSKTATQGCFIHEGKLYQVFGTSNGYLVVRRTSDFAITNEIYLPDISIDVEPEAVCLYENCLLIVCSDKVVHKLTFK